jgi:hypothetical protein
VRRLGRGLRVGPVRVRAALRVLREEDEQDDPADKPLRPVSCSRRTETASNGSIRPRPTRIDRPRIRPPTTASGPDGSPVAGSVEAMNSPNPMP